MNSSKVPYNRSFILRIRKDESDPQKQPCWRYVLLDAEREYRRGFTSLDQLFAALAMELCNDLSPAPTGSQIVREVETLLDAIPSHLPD